MRKEYSSGAIVFKKAESEFFFLLVLSRKNDSWGFPKGHVEKGEDLSATALREIKEETGLSRISFIDGFREEIVYPIISRRSPHEGKPAEKHVIYFLCETDTTAVVIDGSEITDHRWVTYAEALSLLRFPNLKVVLLKAIKRIKKIRVTEN